MKKIIVYLFIGIISSVLTLSALWLFTKYNYTQESYANQDNKEDSGFDLVNYNGRFLDTPDFVEASEKSVNAVVSVKNFTNEKARNYDPFREFFFGFPERRRDPNTPSGLGSGVLISKDGFIVTNNHVIKGAEKVEVVLNNQQSYQARIVGTDPNTDIALIKIDGKNFPHLKFTNSDDVSVGEWVLAIGNPFGLNSTVTAGIVSAKGRSIDILRRNADNPIESFIQTDAVINPGNSGGALVNANGDLVGINTAISSQTGSYIGYGFAVPSNLVKKIVDDLKDYGLVQRGYLGISGIDLSDQKKLKRFNEEFDTNFKSQPGVLVADLQDKGGAISAGVEQYDIIKKIDGKSVDKFSKLSFLVGRKRPGDKVKVEILRGSKTKEYLVTLRDVKGNSKIRKRSDLSVIEKLGADFEPLSERQKINFGIDHGLLLTNVESTGILSSVGMEKGYILLEIDGKKVKSEKDIEKILKNKKSNVSINYIDPYGRIYKRGFQMK